MPGDYLSPAAALWVGAHMWAWLSPNSYHILQCLAASVPVMAGYAQTKKEAATGRLAPGISLPYHWALFLTDTVLLLFVTVVLSEALFTYVDCRSPLPDTALLLVDSLVAV